MDCIHCGWWSPVDLWYIEYAGNMMYCGCVTCREVSIKEVV